MWVTKIEAGQPDVSDATAIARLCRHVHDIAVPRDFWAQPRANRRTGEHIADLLLALGYRVHLQGRYRNVVALPAGHRGPLRLVCAHYDSVALTPGADDNASGVAVLLEVARHAARAEPGRAAIGFVAFNAEEHGLAGSTEFVEDYLPTSSLTIEAAHVLEMVGFTSRANGSQATPLPFRLGTPDVGDFLGVVSNGDSRRELARVLRSAKDLAGAPRLVALQTSLGAERFIPDIHRSDHAPFWRRALPALLWTDTAEFRNPHYHRPSDVPDTLDYVLMANTARLLERSLGLTS